MKDGEMLQIVTTVHNNGKNDDDGVSMQLYAYYIKEKKIVPLMRVPLEALYPAAFADFEREKIFFSNSYNKEDGFDNLYEYDMNTRKVEQLTFGKFYFDDLFVAEGNLIANAAPEYVTVNQPAVFNEETREFRYFNKEDEEIWWFSLSYNTKTKKLLGLTASDAEMRTYRVVAETHIRPKTLYLMDVDFSDCKPVFSTDEYEICMTRQLDEDRILMTTDKFMGTGDPRRLKMLYLDSQKVEDFPIPGIHEVYSFYPRANKEGLFVMGRDENRQFGIFYYDFAKGSVTDIFENYKLPEAHRQTVDFVYTNQ